MIDDMINKAKEVAEGVVEQGMEHVNAAVDNLQGVVKTHTGIDTNAVDAMQEQAGDMAEGISAHDAEAPAAE